MGAVRSKVFLKMIRHSGRLLTEYFAIAYYRIWECVNCVVPFVDAGVLLGGDDTTIAFDLIDPTDNPLLKMARSLSKSSGWRYDR